MGEQRSVIVRREPERLGPYELVHRIGTGGFCETYLARQYGPEGFVTDVCLKRVLPEHVEDQQYMGSLRDEAVLQASISHRHIARVRDFCRIDGHYVVVMDYVDGASLAHLSRWCRGKDSAFPAPLAVYITCKVLLALSAAHRLVRFGEAQELIHRDVTPKNILIDREGDPVLIDFGLVKARHRTYRTESGSVRGTASYMAPETIMAGADGYPHAEDARTDIYTAGVVLYELLSGEHPYAAAAMHDAVGPAIVKGEHRPLEEAAPRIARGLASVVERMMAADPNQRPQSALDAARLLTPYLPIDIEARLELSQLVARSLGGRPSLASGYPAPAEPISDDEAAPGGAKAPVIDTARLRRPSTSPWMASKRLRQPAIWAFVGVLAAASTLVWTTKPETMRAQSPRPRESAATAAPALAAVQQPASTERPIATDAPSVDTESSVSLAAAAPLDDAPSVRVSQASPARGAVATERAPATSRIGVMARGAEPWEVWVDEAYMGETPASVVVAPGVHRVSIGKGQPTLHKTVRVAARQTKSVRFLP